MQSVSIIVSPFERSLTPCIFPFITHKKVLLYIVDTNESQCGFDYSFQFYVVYKSPHVPAPLTSPWKDSCYHFRGGGLKCDSGSNPNHSLYRYRLGVLEVKFFPIFLFFLLLFFPGYYSTWNLSGWQSIYFSPRNVHPETIGSARPRAISCIG